MKPATEKAKDGDVETPVQAKKKRRCKGNRVDEVRCQARRRARLAHGG